MTKQQEMECVLAMYGTLSTEKKAQFDLMVNTVLNMLLVLFETNEAEFCTEQCKTCKWQHWFLYRHF